MIRKHSYGSMSMPFLTFRLLKLAWPLLHETKHLAKNKRSRNLTGS